MCLQVLQIIEEFPQELPEITSTIQSFAEGKPIDFVHWVESHYHEVNPNRNIARDPSLPEKESAQKEEGTTNVVAELSHEEEFLEAERIAAEI